LHTATHRQRLVFLRRGAARPRAGDGVRDDGAVGGNLDERFGRRADDLKVGAEVEEKHVRAGVDDAQVAVDVKGGHARRQRVLDAVRGHGLDDVARHNVRLERPNRRLVPAAPHVGRRVKVQAAAAAAARRAA
jgi:hypothetical protein